MSESGSKKEQSKPNRGGSSGETSPALPISQQYLKTMEGVAKNSKPDENGYLDIHFYAPGEQSSAIHILRLISQYKDDHKGIQDEIRLAGKEHSLQLNAEVDKDGEHIKSPGLEKEETSRYVQECLEAIAQLRATEGSIIVINHKPSFVSHENLWTLAPQKKPIDVSRVMNTLDSIPPAEAERIRRILDKKPLEHQEIIDQAKKFALGYAKKHPPKIGDIVGIDGPYDEKAYEVRSIDREAQVALIGYTDKATGVDHVRQVTLGEIFDANLCQDKAFELGAARLSDKAKLN